jgi:3-hydroxybutyryl-CoA dehydrogenase
LEIQNVTILGGGTLGSQIAFQTAFHGFNVIVYDISAAALEFTKKNHQIIGGLFTTERGVSDQSIKDTMARLSYTTDLTASVADADLTSESVPEDLAVKKQFYKDLAKVAPAKTVFTTNTSTLPPSLLAEETGRPDRFLALHFANLIWEYNIAEVMKHPKTDHDVFERVLVFAKQIGMVPIRLEKEVSGYVCNSLLVPWLIAAQTLVVNGIASVEDIDKTWMIISKMNRGPYGTLDIIGLETAYNVAAHWGEVNDDDQLRKNAAYIKEHFVDRGKLGIKTGEGFYKYPKPKFEDPDFLK